MSTVKQTSPLLTAKTDTKYVDLSIEMKNRSRAKTGDHESMVIQSRNTTYFIYQCGHIKGPFTVNELIGKCVRNEIHLKSEKVLFCPTSITNNYNSNKYNKTWYTLEQLKHSGDGYHEEIYHNLYPLQQLQTIIQQPPHPKITKDLHKKTYGLSLHQLIKILSIILSKLLFIIISLHFIIPLILCTLIFWILSIFCCSEKKIQLFTPYNLWNFIWDSLIFKSIANISDNQNPDNLASVDNINLKKHFYHCTHFVSVFVGFITTPILIEIMIWKYYEHYEGEPIANIWMIGYVVWCAFFIIDYFCINLNLWYKHLTKFIIGLHITKVHKQDLIMILCALSATLPAVIIGYLVNFITEEKMTLECTEDTLSEICIEDKCCFIVSNHEANIANMIVVFAAVRLLSWIVMKADTTLYDITVEPFDQ